MNPKTTRKPVLGVPVDLVTPEQTLEIIDNWLAQPQPPRVSDSAPTSTTPTSEVSTPKHIITAYSEFFVQAQRDTEFMRILYTADLVVPDGVGPLAAVEYQRQFFTERSSDEHRSGVEVESSHQVDLHSKTHKYPRLRLTTFAQAITSGLKIGKKVLTGQLGPTVTGVWLTQKILEQAPERGWKVFLLGGYGDTAEELKKQTISGLSEVKRSRRRVKKQELASGFSAGAASPDLLRTVSKHSRADQEIRSGANEVSSSNSNSEHPSTSTSLRCSSELRSVQNWIQSHPGVPNISQATEAEHQKIIKIINQFQPDILLVAYGPVKQEKWISKYKPQLKTSIIIGVGGTFDELTGRVPHTPVFFQSHGLKWLWRLITQPQRLKRIINAVIAFPWMVHQETTH